MAAGTAPREDLTARLPDGRALGYAEYGDPQGKAVMSFHGGLSSRLDAAPMDRPCRSLGVRLIAPDRPGMGHSDFQPRRTLLDWPADAAALADALGIERFAALGWSAGGPYALACARALPDRIPAAATVGSVAPFNLIGTRRDLNRPDRLMSTLSRWAPPLAALALQATIKWRSPQAVLGAIERTVSEPDRAALRRAGPPEAATAFVFEALRAGTRGVIHDYRVMTAPWGFDLEEVAPPVAVWQGERDELCPPRYARLLADRLPLAHLHACPGVGHFLLHDRGPEVVRELAP